MRTRITAPFTMALVLAWGVTAWGVTAWADTPIVPSATYSTIPSHIQLVGSNANGVADPLGAFTVVVRDGGNHPLAGFTVMLDLDACGEFRLCPGGLFCAPRATAVTNESGVATIIATGYRVSGATATPACARITVNGLLLGSPLTSAFDLDGVRGVTGLDVSQCFADANSGTYLARSDHDGDGDVDPLDVSITASIMFAGGSTNGCPPCY